MTICPYCNKPNQYADDEGYVEGPREYHADCWEKASRDMSDEQIKAAHDESSLPA